MKVTIQYELPDWMYKILKKYGYDFEWNAWQHAYDTAIELNIQSGGKEG